MAWGIHDNDDVIQKIPVVSVGEKFMDSVDMIIGLFITEGREW